MVTSSIQPNQSDPYQIATHSRVVDPRILLSLLAPRAVSFEPMSKGTSPTSLRWDDAIGALALVKNSVAVLLLRVKWGGQEQYRMDLEEAFLLEAYDLFSRRKWEFRISNTLEHLVQMALDEVIYPRICPRCKGRRGGDDYTVIRNRNGVIKECPTCSGSGVSKSRSGRGRAQQLGVGKTQWFEKWEPRFEELVNHLIDLESFSIQEMKKNLRCR